MFSSGPKYQRLTSNLRLAINRLKLLEKKKTEQAVKARREIADYLAAGKDERAKIRVEHIVREDYLVEAMELIEMYCDLLLARMGLIQSTKVMDEGLEEPIATIIWATPRLQAEVQELVVVTDQLSSKYGKDFAQACRANKLSNVNEKVIHKLSVQAPPRALVEKYLEEIAKSYNVPYVPDPHYADAATTDLLFFGKGNGSSGNGSGGGNNSGGNNGGGSVRSPVSQPQPFMYPQMKSQGSGVSQPPPPGFIGGTGEFPDLPTVPVGTLSARSEVGTNSNDVNFDDLAKRFEELKKKK